MTDPLTFTERPACPVCDSTRADVTSEHDRKAMRVQLATLVLRLDHLAGQGALDAQGGPALDAVVLSEVPEHIAALKSLLRALHHRLRKGGVLLSSRPDPPM